MPWILDIDFNIPILNEARLRLTALSLKPNWTHLGLYKQFKDGEVDYYNLDSDWSIPDINDALSWIKEVAEMGEFNKASLVWQEPSP